MSTSGSERALTMGGADSSVGRDSVDQRQPGGVVVCLVLSAMFLGLAPLLMPESYSWIAHTTSESAAQALEGAWLARLGFLAFGLAVLWLSSLATSSWGKWGTGLNRTFAILMIFASAFSHRPLSSEVAFDRTEDFLHSLAATLMGFAFAFGVAAVMWVSHRGHPSHRFLDITAIAASVIIPLAMTVWGDYYSGLLQRMMFLIAYLWYGFEAIALLEPGPALRTTDRWPG